jgi:uncharacterized protein (TIGR02284 family)
MKSNDQVTGVLNDLVKINIDRITGYEKAIKETPAEATELKSLFGRMADQSREFRTELSEAVRNMGGEPADDRTVPGRIYQLWMDIRSSASSDDEKTVLALCEFGEDAAQKAYKKALDDKDLPPDATQLIEKQRSSLKDSHDTIKWERDLHKAL